MKKIFSLCFLSFFLLCLLASPGLSQKASDLLEKLIEAQGGRKILEGIKDTTMSGSGEMTQMGMSITLTFYHKEPNKYRQDIEVMGMVITSAFDGETAWMTNPQTGAVEEMPEQAQAELKRQAINFGNTALLNPEKFSIKYEYKGKESIEGKDYYLLEQTFPDGENETIYLDSKTYLFYKVKQNIMNQMGIEVEQDIIFSDYKKVSGVMFAHTMTIIQEGEEFGKMTLTEVKFNTGLEDSFFKMKD